MIKVVITQKDILKALEDRNKTRSNYCPISQSFLRRLRKNVDVTTGVNVVVIKDCRHPFGEAYTYPLPEIAEQFVRTFDRYCSNYGLDAANRFPVPKPFVFTLPDTSQDEKVKALLK